MAQSYNQFFSKLKTKQKSNARDQANFPKGAEEFSVTNSYESDLDKLFLNREKEARLNEKLLNAVQGEGKSGKKRRRSGSSKISAMSGKEQSSSAVSREQRAKRRRKSNKSSGSIGFVVASLVVMLMSWMLFYPNILSQVYQSVTIYLPTIKLELFGMSQAKEKQGDSGKSNDSKKGIGGEVGSQKEGSDTKVSQTGESGLGHLAKLLERKKELDHRESELNLLEEELMKQKVEVDKRILELAKIRGNISLQLGNRVKVDSKRVDKLVGVYSAMKPQQAADIIASLKEDLAVEIIGKMKKKSAAQIMNKLKASKVKRLSEKYAGY